MDDGNTRPASAAAARVERRDAAAVVRLTGEIDLHTAPRLTAAVDQAVSGSAAGVVVDLAGVSFFGSAGVAALYRAATGAAAQGRPLLLADCSRIVARVLDLTGMRPLFAEHATVEAAVAALGAADEGPSPTAIPGARRGDDATPSPSRHR